MTDISSMESATKFQKPSLNNGETRTDAVTPFLHRFPYCIVWTPIPLLTWLFPVVGHMGIANSHGIIYDFAAPYTIGEDQMAFGWPTMYYQPHSKHIPSREIWDKALFEANEVYKGRVHNLLCDNCHSHVAYALNKMRFQDKDNWNMIRVTVLLFFHGKYVSKRHFIASWLPFIILICTILLVISLTLHIR
ncbi:unnamed protein product [Trichobilharzia szidati]|nr:unnamed protein product [Trichobilharzia szidati]CAH8826682.1 unnamed protein product [Trichobilharzia szidati]